MSAALPTSVGLLGLLACLLVTACAVQLARPPALFAGLNGPLIIAHRGGALEAPENTLAAVRHGIEVGSDWQEVDVQLSRDDVPVIMHDDTVDRTTDGRGAVSRLRAVELTQLRAGAPTWLESDRQRLALFGMTPPDYGARFADERVPTLAQVLALPNARLMLELKDSPRPARLVEKVMEAVYHAGAEQRVGIASFSTKVLQAAYERDPNVPLIGLAEDPKEIERVLEQPVAVLAVRVDYLDDALRAAPQGVAVWAWTAYSSDMVQALVERGAHGVITDVPAAALKVLRDPDIYVRPSDPRAP